MHSKKKNHMQIFAANQPVSALAQSFRSADWVPHSCYKPNWLSHSLDITGGDHMGTTAHHTHTHTHHHSTAPHTNTFEINRSHIIIMWWSDFVLRVIRYNRAPPLFSIQSRRMLWMQTNVVHRTFISPWLVWSFGMRALHTASSSLCRAHRVISSESPDGDERRFGFRLVCACELFYWYDLCRHSELLNWILTKTNKFDDCVVVISKDFFGATIKKANIIQMLMWFVSIKVLLVHATLNRVRCKFLCQNQQCAQHGDPNACDEKNFRRKQTKIWIFIREHGFWAATQQRPINLRWSQFVLSSPVDSDWCNRGLTASFCCYKKLFCYCCLVSERRLYLGDCAGNFLCIENGGDDNFWETGGATGEFRVWQVNAISDWHLYCIFVYPEN